MQLCPWSWYIPQPWKQIVGVGSHVTEHIMPRLETVSEMSDIISILTWLIAWEDFTTLHSLAMKASYTHFILQFGKYNFKRLWVTMGYFVTIARHKHCGLRTWLPDMEAGCKYIDDTEWSSNMEVGWGTNTPALQKTTTFKMLHRASDLDRFFK